MAVTTPTMMTDLGQVRDFMEELFPQLGIYEYRGSGQVVA